MKKYIKMFLIPGLLIGDIVIACLSAYLGVFIRFGGMIPLQYINSILQFGLTCSILLIVFGILVGSYYNVWERASISEMVKQAIVVALAFLLMVFFNYILEMDMPGTSIFTAAFFTLFGTLTLRLLTRFYQWLHSLFKRTQNSGKNRVLIIGAGEAGILLAKNLINKPQNERIPIGYIDDNNKLWNQWINGLPVFGGREMLKNVIIRQRINEVVIAINEVDKSVIQDLFEKCKSVKCKLKRYDTMQPIDENDINKVNIREVNVEELLGRDPVKMDMQDVKNFIGGKVVMVTGGAGSIGSEICRQVLALNCKQLIIFDFHENGLFDIDKELARQYSRTKYELVLGSIRDVQRLDYVFEEYKPEVVFHAAAHKHVPMMEWNPFEAVKNNIIGTLNVARKADEYKVQKFIMISTDKAVNPPNIMGATKRVAELCVQITNAKSETEYAAVRFGNVLGSNGSVVPFFKEQIAKGGPVTVTHPDIKRYFMTIPEAVQLVLQAGAMANGGEVFVLDMGVPVKIYDLAVTLIQLSGLEPEKDIKIEFTGLRPGEKLFEEISLSDEEVSKTANNKIFVMKNTEYSFVKLSHQIELIQKYVEKEQKDSAFAMVHELVPTYNYREYTIPEIKSLPLKSIDMKNRIAVSESTTW
jgi:Predicted nucleoside-diphosphate sugar epimerases